MSIRDYTAAHPPPTPVATLFTRHDGVISGANVKASLLLGRSERDLVGQPLSSVLCDADRWLRQLNSPAEPMAAPLRLDTKWVVPGHAPVLQTAWVEPMAGGGGLRWLLPDLRDQEPEAALRHEKEKFQALIDAVPCTLSWVSADLKYLLVNHQVAALLGTTPEAFIGEEVGFLGKDPFFVDFVRSVFDSPERRTTTEVSLDAGGEGREFLIIGSRYADDREATIIGLDITERKRAEEALWETNEQLSAANARSAEAVVLLEQARDQAEAANRAKDRFLANMSHEMLTPLNGVLGIADMLLERSTGTDFQNLLRTLQGSARSLQELIRDVLTVSAPAVAASERSVPFELRSAVKVAAEAVEPLARQKGLRFETRIAPAVPEAVLGDPDLLEQILRRLLDNAVKFTEEGQIVLSVVGNETGPERTEVEFTVTDTGIGVPPGGREAIFEPFVQADDSNTRTHGGAGLGLAIAARLAARMGGELTLESPCRGLLPGPGGPGSEFRLSVRFTRATAWPAEASGAAKPPASFQSLHVLVAEDNTVNRLVARRHLEAEGHSVRFAGDGLEAVAACRSERFDAVLMDIQMPGLDGFQALAAIRAEEADGGRKVPVIALTAHALPGYEERCLAAGMDGFVPKPLRREALVAALQRVAGIASAPAVAAPSDIVTPEPSLPEELVSFDREASLALAQGDEEFLRELANVFLEDCPRLLTAVKQAAVAADAPGLRGTAHALKGAIAAFAAPRAWQAAREMEHLGRRGNLAEVDVRLAALERAVRDLCDHLSVVGSPTTSAAAGGGGS